MECSGKVVDVICQHTRDNKIIPMRIRIQDEDGEFHIYNIKSYKDTSPSATYEMPNHVFVTKGIWTFECKIVVFNQIKRITLLYDPRNNKWEVR